MSKEKESVIEIIQQIEQNMELFYQQKDEEALKEFNLVLREIMAMVDILFAYRENHLDFSVDEDKIKSSLAEALNALESRDLVLLADVIQYDFVEYVNELVEKME